MTRISIIDFISFGIVFSVVYLSHTLLQLIQMNQFIETDMIIQSSTPFTQQQSQTLFDNQITPITSTPSDVLIPTNHTFQLVLFTTEDGLSTSKVNKIKLYRDVCDLYTSQFNFRALLFTHTPQLISLVSHSSVIPVTDFSVNPYGLPIITSLYSKAQQLFDSEYYGYVNSDILIEPTLFAVLSFCGRAVRSSLLNPCHEIAGRVYERSIQDIPTSFTSFGQLESYFANYTRNRFRIRSRGSADYFVFSKEAMHLATNTSQSAVIGRMQIDNYLMGVVSGVGELVDATVVVKGIHEGVDGFYNRRVNTQTRENRGWNYGVMRNTSTHYGYLSETGNKVLRMHDGKCCTLSTVKWISC